MVWYPVLRVQFFKDFFSVSLSSSFKIVGSKLIDRQDETSNGFFPGFFINIICANFNVAGQLFESQYDADCVHLVYKFSFW